MPKALDLTGQKFGKLTALRRLPNQGRRTIWECQCDCGNIIPVRAENLRSGHTTSCGCKKREPSKKFVDLTGQKFGEWTVLSKAEKESYWLCECSCGVKREVYAPSLKSGKSLSCGHLFKNQIRNPIIGSRYGNLIVLEQFKENDTWYCKCQCDCGNITIVKRQNLTSGNTQSCGCIISKGEARIKRILQEANIPFISQWTPQDYPNQNGITIMLCHAGFTPAKEPFPANEDLLWDREHIYDTTEGEGICVHGHTPISEYLILRLDNANNFLPPDRQFSYSYNGGALWYCDNHKVDIDCCSYMSGKTVLLNLDTFDEHIFTVDKEDE